jgi:hypothetical protein
MKDRWKHLTNLFEAGRKVRNGIAKRRIKDKPEMTYKIGIAKKRN